MPQDEDPYSDANLRKEGFGIKDLIFGFYEDEFPMYSQGDNIMELCELATAEEINNIVDLYETSKKTLEAYRKINGELHKLLKDVADGKQPMPTDRKAFAIWASMAKSPEYTRSFYLWDKLRERLRNKG